MDINDICYTTTSRDGTDISLKDRKKEYIKAEQIICQEEYIVSEYDYEAYKAKCSCDVKGAYTYIVDMKFNKERLLKNFKDIETFLILIFYFVLKTYLD